MFILNAMYRADFCILITKELIFAGLSECAKIVQISIDQQALYAGIPCDITICRC
jgi:hypothetical protein